MKSTTARELERRLGAIPAGEPPPDLGERIKSEIPDELPLPAEPVAAAPARPWHHPHRWRLAAALVMVVGGGAVAWWTWRDEPRPGAPAVETAVRWETAPPAAGVAEPAAPATTPPEVDPSALKRRLGDADAEPERAAPEREELAVDQLPVGRDIAEILRSDATARSTDLSDEAPPPPPAARQRESGAAAEAGEARTDPAEEPEQSAVWVGTEANITFRDGSPRSESDVAGPFDDEARTPEEARERMRRRLEELPRGLRREQSEPAAKSEDRDLQIVPTLAAAAEPSTGGTDEPNDAPYGDVFFRHYGVNPFLDPEEDKLSTFALDVDTGSWGVVRRYLDGGDRPPPEAVRVEEIVNALDYGDPPPADGDFALYAEGAPTPFGGSDRYRLLRFAIQAREVDPADRKPAALTFVVDVSGSMGQENRLGLVKASLGLLLDELRPDDRVALVTYGSRGRVVLAPTADKEALRTAVDGLQPEGSTNAEEGLSLGYQVASSALRPGAINRVILASDGVANVGATGPDSILATVRSEAARGIELTTLGFGMGNYNDVLMERLADDGDGRYAYLDTLEEARRVLVEELTGTLQTVAEEARAQVEINPEAVERYRLLGYENRDVADERFRDDTVDAGEIGAGHTVTALYEVKLKEQATGRAGERAYRDAPVATLRLRWRPAGGEAFVETERLLRLGDLAPSWERATPALRLAGLAAELAELLRGSYWAREGSLDEVFRGLQRLQPELAGDARAAELAAMAGRAARLETEAEPQERP